MLIGYVFLLYIILWQCSGLTPQNWYILNFIHSADFPRNTYEYNQFEGRVYFLAARPGPATPLFQDVNFGDHMGNWKKK
jgi:hypothetical protein